MRERLAFENELSRLEPDPCQQTLRALAPALSVPVRIGQPAELANARSVMWQLIAILGKTQSAREANPDNWAKPPPWFKVYRPLLKQWYLVAYGDPVKGSGRQQARGKALNDKINAAFARTRPILELLKKHGGKAWEELLRTCFYPKVAELDQLAAESGPRIRRSAAYPAVDIPNKPAKEVSHAEFMSIATRPAEAQPLQRGMGGTQFGMYKPGSAFSLAGGERRVVLWTGGDVVFFLKNGKIYAQRGPGFSDDVLMGAFIKGFEDAAGAVMLAELMIDIGLSFTPWGVLWDGVSALRDISKGDWVGAAATLLPGAALKSATTVKAVKRTAKGGSITKPLAKEIAGLRTKPGSSFYAGRGGYEAKDGWHRGTWMIEQPGAAGGQKKYHFFDESDETLIELKEAQARDYVTCSRCTYSTRGLKGVLYTEVDRQLTKISRRKSYSSNRRPLIRRQVVNDLVLAYGTDAEHIIDDILESWDKATDAARHAEDTMIVATQLSKIKGKFGYQDAADIFSDLAINSTTTVRGAQFELEWAAKHLDEVEAMGVPTFLPHWRGVGKGLDTLKKNGVAVELKNFDFTKAIYEMDPGRAAAGIKRQARSRLLWKDPPITGVTFVFNSRAGAIPAPFEAELDKVAKALAKEFKQPVRFEFWPR